MFKKLLCITILNHSVVELCLLRNQEAYENAPPPPPSKKKILGPPTIDLLPTPLRPQREHILCILNFKKNHFSTFREIAITNFNRPNLRWPPCSHSVIQSAYLSNYIKIRGTSVLSENSDKRNCLSTDDRRLTMTDHGRKVI